MGNRYSRLLSKQSDKIERAQGIINDLVLLVAIAQHQQRHLVILPGIAAVTQRTYAADILMGKTVIGEIEQFKRRTGPFQTLINLLDKTIGLAIGREVAGQLLIRRLDARRFAVKPLAKSACEPIRCSTYRLPCPWRLNSWSNIGSSASSSVLRD